jgi:hypothetical protein
MIKNYFKFEPDSGFNSPYGLIRQLIFKQNRCQKHNSIGNHRQPVWQPCPESRKDYEKGREKYNIKLFSGTFDSFF